MNIIPQIKFMQIACIVFLAYWCGIDTPLWAQDSTQSKAANETDSWQSLFDGKSLEGWSGDNKFWSVVDGVINGQTSKTNPTDGNTFLIWQGGEIDNFELQLQYKITNGNSGIQFRSTDLGDHRVSGYQADIDFGNNFTGILYEERGRGILARRTQHVIIGSNGEKRAIGGITCDEANLLKSIKPEGWNHYVIRAKDGSISQTLNGHVTVVVSDRQVEKSKSSGILALQLHAGPPMKVQFKDIRIRQLDR